MLFDSPSVAPQETVTANPVSSSEELVEVTSNDSQTQEPILGEYLTLEFGYYAAVVIFNGPLPTDTLNFIRYYSRLIPIYSTNRDNRARQLIFEPEDLKHIPEAWERAWPLEMPDRAKPYRVHGGVI